MACLVHDVRYRSLFHGVVNELRNEKRISIPMLRNMPNRCCTCNDIDKLTLISVLLHDKDNLKNLQNLISQVDRDKTTNPKLVLSLNRLENFIKENRGPLSEPSQPEANIRNSRSPSRESRSSSSSRHDDVMETDKPKPKKPVKPLKNGTFLFLPYKFEVKPKHGSSLEAAKKLQRGRFLGRNKYIQSIEKEHNIRINMLTPTTSEQIKQALTSAKAGTGNVKIHNPEDFKDEEEINGEWILVRQKSIKNPADTAVLETVLTELKNRWDRFLKVQKRKSQQRDDDTDDDEHPNKK